MKYTDMQKLSAYIWREVTREGLKEVSMSHLHKSLTAAFVSLKNAGFLVANQGTETEGRWNSFDTTLALAEKEGIIHGDIGEHPYEDRAHLTPVAAANASRVVDQFNTTQDERLALDEAADDCFVAYYGLRRQLKAS